jgi:hypothetical protein
VPAPAPRAQGAQSLCSPPGPREVAREASWGARPPALLLRRGVPGPLVEAPNLPPGGLLCFSAGSPATCRLGLPEVSHLFKK